MSDWQPISRHVFSKSQRRSSITLKVLELAKAIFEEERQSAPAPNFIGCMFVGRLPSAAIVVAYLIFPSNYLIIQT
jgi:hypothetical protein